MGVGVCFETCVQKLELGCTRPPHSHAPSLFLVYGAQVEPVGGFSYSYELEVNGKSYHKFNENQGRAMRTWLATLPNDEQYRVVLGMPPT